MNVPYYHYHCLKQSLCLLMILSIISLCSAAYFPNVYPRVKLEAKLHGDAGDPLIITPYLQQGSINLAQNLSRVSITDKLGFRSHAGFFCINDTYNSNLYFWYFPPFSGRESAPVLLWLQGGPGGSSLFGLFTELGPLIAKKEGFALRKYHWALDYHLIFIDNPVGTGFSFTENAKAYCTDEDCVADGLYKSLIQFFQLFPNLMGNELYISGESYAGKYLPSLGMAIHQQNLKSQQKINLKGIAMGNAYCDPVNQLNYGAYLYQHGLLDDNQLSVFLKYEAEIKKQIVAGNWAQADILMDKLMDGATTNTSFFKEYTGFDNYYNFLEATSEDDMTIFGHLLQNDNIRRSVHVGGLPFNDGSAVQLNLAYDILQSVAPEISELLSHYHIMFYNGQLDIIVAYPLTEKFLSKLDFSSSEEYKKALRHIWRVDGEIAGYVKRAGNLTEVLVRNAGHMVPHDQPKWALDLIRRFITKNWGNLEGQKIEDIV